MDILILGASTVGTSVAEALCQRSHNIVLVDDDPELLARAEERLDVSTLAGSPCDAITLFQAGASSADLCLAVTQSDEINLVGASLARAMGASRSIARVFRSSYLDQSTFDYQRHFGIDRLISLENLTALELAREIRLPGLYAVENFARGELEVQEVVIDRACPSVDVPLATLSLPRGARVGMISRGGATFIPGANDTVRVGDHITLFGDQETLATAKKLFVRRSPTPLGVAIAGGGEVGRNLAKLLAKAGYPVTVLEANAERARVLSETLPSDVLVLNADGTSRSEMEEARIGQCDVFVGATGRDADNIVCALEARELGCKRVMGVVRKPDYTDILKKVGMDAAVSPREVMETLISGYLNDGLVLSRTSLADGQAEMWELEVPKNSQCLGQTLRQLNLTNSLVAAIIRDDFVHVPGPDDEFRPGDTVILLVQAAHADAMLTRFTSEP